MKNIHSFMLMCLMLITLGVTVPTQAQPTTVDTALHVIGIDYPTDSTKAGAAFGKVGEDGSYITLPIDAPDGLETYVGLVEMADNAGIVDADTIDNFKEVVSAVTSFVKNRPAKDAGIWEQIQYYAWGTIALLIALSIFGIRFYYKNRQNVAKLKMNNLTPH